MPLSHQASQAPPTGPTFPSALYHYTILGTVPVWLSCYVCIDGMLHFTVFAPLSPGLSGSTHWPRLLTPPSTDSLPLSRQQRKRVTWEWLLAITVLYSLHTPTARPNSTVYTPVPFHALPLSNLPPQLGAAHVHTPYVSRILIIVGRVLIFKTRK